MSPPKGEEEERGIKHEGTPLPKLPPLKKIKSEPLHRELSPPKGEEEEEEKMDLFKSDEAEG